MPSIKDLLKSGSYWILAALSFSSPAVGLQAKLAKLENFGSHQDTLIAREVLFGNPEKRQVKLSPNGRHLSYIAPLNGVMNIWVKPEGVKVAKPLSHNVKRGVMDYFWAYNNEQVLFIDDKDGDENWRLHVADIKNHQLRTLVDIDKVQVRIFAASHKLPQLILVGINQRRSDYHDVYQLNLKDGRLSLYLENNEYADFLIDDDLQIRGGYKTNPEGGADVYAFDEKKPARLLLNIAQDDVFATKPYDLNKDGSILYLLDSRNRNTAALTAVNMQNGETQLLAEDAKADIEAVLLHPTERSLQAVAGHYLFQNWQFTDKVLEKDFAYLKTVSEGEIQLASRSLDDQHWLVVYLRDNAPVHYYQYNRKIGKAEFLFTNQPALENMPLVPMHALEIKSRDGLNLVSYLSLPPQVSYQAGKILGPAIPLVVTVHGGPQARDYWSFNAQHQWLANRGYAVLSVNYRGSTGFGKNFINAGNGEWSGKMHTDLIDAVNWAVQQGIALPDKVAIMGGSYGGYAALVGLSFTPDVFACGVDLVGPSNLATLLQSIPPYWKDFYVQLINMIGGDPATASGLAALKARSPLTYADKIKKPLLIAQGANDPRVKQAESEQIVNRLLEKKIPVTYLLYPDEGHGFNRPENRLSFYAMAEAFLARHLGGRLEPINQSFKGANFEIKAGKDLICKFEKTKKPVKKPDPADQPKTPAVQIKAKL